jgi:hypothetical protein
MTPTARTRVRRPPFQVGALGLAASVALGFLVQSCGVPASNDCTEKANCPSDGPDGHTAGDAAVATGVVNDDAADLSATDVARLVAEDVNVVDVAVDRSVLDRLSGDSTLEDTEDTMETGPGEGGDVVVAADAQGAGDASGAEGAGGDAASDGAIVDAGRDGPSVLCATGHCPAACAAASVILQIPKLRGDSGSFGTTDSACVLFHGSVNASRGCARTCSFCSIQTFYRAATGRIVRTRRPAKVVEEMRQLHEERGTTIFLFQDDDLPLFGKVWRCWAYEFADELQKSGLVGRMIGKINCRADAVDADLLATLGAAGLYFVYMGLESGNDEGLRALHKQVTVEQNIRAVEVLKQLDLRYEYGFMLLDPSSTFESVRENIRFLRTIVGDASCTAVFCRMLPYDGTAIKDDLARAGRLRGNVSDPDYDFLDPTLDRFYRVLTQFIDIQGWVHGQGALSWHVSWTWHEVSVLERLFPPLDGMKSYSWRCKTSRDGPTRRCSTSSKSSPITSPTAGRCRAARPISRRFASAPSTSS